MNGITLSHKSDGTPYAQVYLGRNPITGKATRPYKEFPGMTDAEAMEAATIWRDSITDTYAKDSQRAGAMLGRYVDYMESQGRSFNTIKTYRMYTRRYAAPIARTPLAKITATMLDDLFHELRAKGPKGGEPLSPNTVKKFREYLKGAFRYFVGLGLIGSNPVSDTMSIQATKARANALDHDEVSTLLAHIRETLEETPDNKRGITRRNAALGMLLALYTGARVGEICALRWRDLNRRQGLLSINGNVVRRDHRAVRQGQTKGKRPRNVSIDEGTMKALQDHMSWQGTYLQHIDRNTPICTVDGSHMAPETLSGQFRACRIALGLDPCVTFHSLRHTHATMLLESGVDMKTVSERLGHSDVSITLGTYAHVMPGRDRAAAEEFSRILGNQ